MTGSSLVGGALVGSVVGSAAGVAMHRWPAGATLRSPSRSTCAACGRTIAARDLVPVISWLLLRGRCRGCSSRIDARLPLLEAGSALVCAWILLVHGVDVLGALLAVGAVAVLVAALVDLEHGIVPDRLTYPLGLLALVALPLLSAGTVPLGTALAWAVGLPLSLRLLNAGCDRIGRARHIGGGDVKLLVGVLGLAAAVPRGPAAVLLIALVSGGAVAIIGLVTGRLHRRARMPFAPAIAVGYLATVLAPERAGAFVTHLGGAPWHG
jgi:leader peptidase (prepilin peptidase)/N-methyltransferase